MVDIPKRRSRSDLIKRILLTLAFLMIAAYATGLIVEWRRLQTVKQLIADFQTLEVGKTTEAQLDALTRRFGGTGSKSGAELSEPPSYEIFVRPPLIQIGERFFPLPGRKLWLAIVFAETDRGLLKSSILTVGMIRRDGVQLESEVHLRKKSLLGWNEDQPYTVYQAHVTGPPTETLSAELLPTATAEERRKAYHFDLDCLSGWKSCDHVCSLMPDAWKDLPKDRRRIESNGGVPADAKECLP